MAQAAARPMGLRQILRSEPVVWIILATTLTANLAPEGWARWPFRTWSTDRFHAGASGYGALIARQGHCWARCAAGQMRSFGRPAIVGSAAFLLEAGAMALVLFSSDALALGFLLAAFGAMNGFGNAITITAFQRWAPPQLLGRLTGILLLCSFGTSLRR